MGEKYFIFFQGQYLLSQFKWQDRYPWPRNYCSWIFLSCILTNTFTVISVPNVICLFCFWQCFLVQGSISLAYQVSNKSLCRARAQVSCAHLLKIRRKIRSKIRRKVSESGSGVSTPGQLAAISTSCVHCRCVWVLLIALLCFWVGAHHIKVDAPYKCGWLHYTLLTNIFY